jgi:hypothetical protein
MGDRCSMTITMRTEDVPKFSEASGLGEQWWDRDEGENEIISELVAEEMNYAALSECDKAAKAGCVFLAEHGAGGDYGPGEYAAFGKKFVDTEVSHSGSYIIHVDDLKNPDPCVKQGLGFLKEFREVYEAAYQYIYKEEHNEG